MSLYTTKSVRFQFCICHLKISHQDGLWIAFVRGIVGVVACYQSTERSFMSLFVMHFVFIGPYSDS